MKKLILLLIIVALCVGIYMKVGDSKEAKIDQDYDKIETVKKAMEKEVHTSSVRTVDHLDSWNIFDLRLIYEKDGKFYKNLKADLGDDFDTKLSTGDYIFVGVYPVNQTYRIYAGDPADPNNMLYPDWKYTKLEKR